MNLRNIIILEKETNKKGDLFGRLMADLFHTLGYNEPRLNIHKSGREIDLHCTHRTESKVAIAECKAHIETIGGADINKFVGVIDAEKRKLKKGKAKTQSTIGYFISLSGFKETAIQQESEFDNKRVILIKPEKIVEELIKGRVLVSKEKAIASLSVDSELHILNYVDLLAYEKGWIWAFFYSNSNGQRCSHFALVHAEGKPLINDIAEEIVNLDSLQNGVLKDLISINRNDVPFSSKGDLKNTEKKYFNYLENELGDIHFEGLPTDKEAGSVKVKLENIFVPLHLKSTERKRDVEYGRQGIGSVLNESSRLAILAKPGGGKSTMIKRIAIAYAFPERRKEINDNLPDKDWFPIFLRCRELGENVLKSITEIIQSIPLRAEIHSCLSDFSVLVSKSLQTGRALLLIDGLDEIAEDKSRIAFVNQLRTFIGTYPNINIIVTSRQAGFRVVAGSLATYCENYTVSNLIGREVEELCLKWHNAIIDDSENTNKEAKKLSELILRDSRIKVLAENPLLLTTLLFVKRWAGYLPTKRSVLYQEMIKLLLVTWNVEGHEMLDIEEAEPQLAFIAYWMTKNGQQTITAEDLNGCLIEARKQMPEILGYTNISPAEFIKRVESRSSLLIMAGHKSLESGNLTAVYEFLHLSFQEYLTAKAIVKKFISNADAGKSIVDIIKPNINNENWKEVIPLTAVLLERDTKSLIGYLITESKEIAAKKKRIEVNNNGLAPVLLGSCLANEIQISPELLGEAIEWYARGSHELDRSSLETILKSKFGIKFKAKISEKFFEKYDDRNMFDFGSILADIYLIDAISNEEMSVLDQIVLDLSQRNKLKNCLAVLGMMQYSYSSSRDHEKPEIDEKLVEEIFSIMYDFLLLNDNHYTFSVAWSIAWSVKASIFPSSKADMFIPYLITAWICEEENLRTTAAWALSFLLTPTISQSVFNFSLLENDVLKNFDNPLNEFDKLVAICLDIIAEEKWISKDVSEYLKAEIELRRDKSNANLILFAEKLNIEWENTSFDSKE